MADEPREWKKRPLALHEVPLPPGGGFSHDLLDPQWKVEQIALHKDLVKQKMLETAGISERAKDDEEYAEAVLALCARDIEFWIDHFVWVHEPRQHEDRPLVLYDFQRTKIVRPYCALRDTQAPARATYLKAKSRDMGATWVELACRTHSFLFKDGWSILIGAVNQKLVDKGGATATHETLMGKIRFIIRHLPKWMRDKLLGPKWEKQEYTKNLAQINPMKPNNVIDGGHVSDLFGRSGRYSEAFIDEFAYADKIKAAERAIKQTTTRFCGVSTPHGRGNLFEQLMFTQEMRVTQFWIWWPEHPEKDLNWYNLERDSMEDFDVASELDISFDESAGDRVLPDVHIPKHFLERVGGGGPDLDDPRGLWEPGLPLQVVIDFGASHPMAAIWGQWNNKAFPPWGAIIDFVHTQGKSVDWIVPFLLGEVPRGTWRGDPWPHVYTAVEMAMIRRHARWGPAADVFGDWQGSTMNLVTGAHSAFDELEKYGVMVTPVKIQSDYDSIVAARQLMNHVRVDKRLVTQRNADPKWCPTFGEVVTQWKFPKAADGKTLSNLKPVHDRFCHGGDCLKMWAMTVDVPDSSVAVSAHAGKVVAKRGSDIVRGRWRR